MCKFNVVLSMFVLDINKIFLSKLYHWMQVSRGNILKTTGMLCNPNFIHGRIIGILI